MSVRFSYPLNVDIEECRFEALVTLVSLISFFHRVFYEYKFTIWIDEQYTQQFAQWSIPRLFTEFISIQPHLPPFYVLVKAWGLLFGYDIIVLRILPVLLTTLSIPIGAYFARELWGGRAGVIAALVLASSPWLVYLSHLLRMYGPMFSLSLLLLYAAHRSDLNQNAHSAHSTLLSAAIIWMHYFGVFTAGAYLLDRLLDSRTKRDLLAATLVFVSFLPVLGIIILKAEPSGAGGTVNEITHITSPPTGMQIVQSMSRVLGFVPQTWLGIAHLLFAWALLGIGLVKYPSKRWALWVCCPIIGAVLVSYLIHPAYNTRYIAAATPPLFLWIVKALDETDWRIGVPLYVLTSEPLYFVLWHYL